MIDDDVDVDPGEDAETTESVYVQFFIPKCNGYISQIEFADQEFSLESPYFVFAGVELCGQG